MRFIFDLALDGKTRPEIVTVLNDRGFPTPAEYNRQHGHGKKDMVTDYPLWDHIKVSNILRQEAYTGKLIMRKRVKVAPCAKKHRPTEPSEQFVRENAHEPIVSQEEFDRVQAMIPKRKGWNRENQKQYPLKGLVRCGTCGKVMPLHDQRPGGVFQCQEALIGHSVCSRKLFPMPEVEQTVFQTLQPILRKIIQEEKKHSRKQKEKRLSQCKSNRSDLMRKREQLQQQKAQCYEAYVSGVLTLEVYLEQKSVYTQRGQELDQQIAALDGQQTMLSFSSVPADLRQAADNAKTFSSAEELTREMVVCFIHRIYLYESHIEIQWKFKDLFEQLSPASLTDKGVNT